MLAAEKLLHTQHHFHERSLWPVFVYQVMATLRYFPIISKSVPVGSTLLHGRNADEQIRTRVALNSQFFYLARDECDIVSSTCVLVQFLI